MALMAAIVMSNLVDGRLARKLGTVGSRGALIDSGCDAAVVLCAMITLGLNDPRYLAMAGLAAMAFISYGVYSMAVRRFGHTQLGRYDGVMCHVLLVVARLRPWLPRDPGGGDRRPFLLGSQGREIGSSNGIRATP